MGLPATSAPPVSHRRRRIRRHTLLGVAAVTALMIVALTSGLLRVPGRALTAGKDVVSLRTVAPGTNVYVLGPALSNSGPIPIELTALRPVSVPPGVRFLDAAVYSRQDFSGAVPTAFGGGPVDGIDPARRPSTPVTGHVIEPGQDDQHFILLRFEVDTDQPRVIRDIDVTYQHFLLTRSQTVPVTYRFNVAVP